MPRSSRIDAPGALHHVIIRGIERRRIFMDARDYGDFLVRLADLVPATQTQCLAWALMGNHAHFLLRSGPSGLPELMRRLLTGYAVRFNRRHKRHGQLFQNRYKSILCQEDAYLKELVRYIHLNPVRAGLMADLEGLKGYAYCGHGVLLGVQARSWQDDRYVLEQFERNVRSARRRYLAFMQAGMEQGRREELTGGGLIRSLGGWSAVKGGQRKAMGRIKSDARILGDSEFVQSVLEQADQQLERTYARTRQGWTAEMVARQVAALFEMTPQELLRKGRPLRLVEARSLYCYACCRELGLALTEVARTLEMTPAGVGYAVRRGERIAHERGFRLEALVI